MTNYEIMISSFMTFTEDKDFSNFTLTQQINFIAKSLQHKRQGNTSLTITQWLIHKIYTVSINKMVLHKKYVQRMFTIISFK